MYTLATLRADLTARVSLASDPTLVLGWQNSAIVECVDSCWWRIQDVTFADLTLTTTATRWTLAGQDVTVLPPALQTQPDGIAAAATYAAFTDIAWRQAAPDSLIVEQMVDVLGAAVTTGTPTASISATAAPALATGVNKVRVWYQRRVPQPDLTVSSSLVRVPDQFARIATLYYYLGTLADNQVGGDMRQWRKRSDEYYNQARILYSESVPLVPLASKKSDEWLLTGRPG